MFKQRPNFLKLKTNLRLCINRLKLLEKKKAELALKSRSEIAEYLKNGKEDRARIRVESIIREDYKVEAMEIIEMFCDLLLARFGLIEKTVQLDPGLEETVASIIWVTPILSCDVLELKEVCNQFTLKYGKEFAESCTKNRFKNVNEKVVSKLTLSAPSRILIENYLIEIAKSYKISFVPDPFVMMDEKSGIAHLVDLEGSRTYKSNDIPYDKKMEAFRGCNFPSENTIEPLPYDSNITAAPVVPPYSSLWNDESPPGYYSVSNSQHLDGVRSSQILPNLNHPYTMLPSVPPNYPNTTQDAYNTPALPAVPPNQFDATKLPHLREDPLYPSRTTGVIHNASDDCLVLPDVPCPPTVHSNSVGISSNSDVDFDELTRRFEDLKRQK